MSAKIRLFQSGELITETEGKVGETVLQRVSAAGVFLDAPCGGRGRCGKCLVRLSPDGEAVKACQTPVTGDMDIYLPDKMEMTIAGAGAAAGISADAAGQLGFAVDIGTTTVVAHLTNITTGKRLATASGVNAQRPYGADVISRIQYCATSGHETLTKLIRGQLRDLFADACKKAGALPASVGYVVIVGNTIMEHLAQGYSPVGMGIAPFAPVSLFGDELPAGDDLGLAPGAVIYYAPAISSYVGGDITAGMLAADLENNDGPCIYLDIGTNGEMALKVGDIYHCCATAAGPAFEGAEISCGMAAIPGAISHVKLTEDGFPQLTVLGDIAPRGLCGSGLLDTLAVLIETGVVDESGRLVDPEEAPESLRDRVGEVGGKNAFFLSREHNVYLSSADVRKLQLAKSAIAAGIQTLLHEANLKSEDVRFFALCGGFGSYMDQTSAAKIGLFPKVFLPVSQTLGNTAGEGAAVALLSQGARDTLSDIRRKCNYIELSTSSYFNDQFVEQMMFEG